MGRRATVDEFIAAATQWKTELAALREILRSEGLDETIKWGMPVFTRNGKNVVGLGAFKSYVGLWFFQGALLSDSRQRLVNAQEGRTRAMRQLRFASAEEIEAKLIRSYVREATTLLDQGTAIKPVRDRPVVIPEELGAALRRDERANAGFGHLTPGRQREYAEFVASARRDDTKRRRIAKILPMIAAGIGLNDRYR